MAFLQCNGLILKGKVAELREQLKVQLPADLTFDNDGVPEYATQDEVMDEISDESDDEPHIDIRVKFEELREGECVEVFWEGEKNDIFVTLTEVLKFPQL